MGLNIPAVHMLVRLAIAEDLSQGDITSKLSISNKSRSIAKILVKEPCIVSGVELIQIVFKELNYKAKILIKIKDGEVAKIGDVIATIHGSTRDLLAAERTILNFLQRTSGVATFTHNVVKKSHGLAVLDTRKTMPGWRAIDKYSVKVGGGKNHRFSLGDMILVKNNHIDAAKSIPILMRHIILNKPKRIKVEVEVRSQEELLQVLPFKPDVIMLDNMNDQQVRPAVAAIRKVSPKTLIEVSGGVTDARFKSLKQLGVDCVSMGALTTKAPNVDISMRIAPASSKK